MNRLLIFTTLFVAAGAVASANPHYVASYGNDTNQCTDLAPCRTFVRAMQVTPFCGNILALDAGDFGLGATLAVNFGVTIDGGAHGAFYSGPNNAPAIKIAIDSAPCPTTIRNISILTGSGSGAAAISGTVASAALGFEKVTVTTTDPFNADGISVDLDSQSRINFAAVTITGARICFDVFNSGANGLFKFAASFQEVIATQCNLVGLGVLAGNATIRDSTFRDSGTGFGIHVIAGPTNPQILIEHSQITNLLTGLDADNFTTVRLSNSVVSGNSTGITGNGTVISFRNNVFAGNGSDGPISLSTSLK